MKRFRTYPKVKTDVHAGVFFVERFRDVLELTDAGEVTILRELQPFQAPSLPHLTGHVTEKKRDEFSAVLTNPTTGTSIGLTALIQGDDLICHFSSLTDCACESDLFVRI